MNKLKEIKATVEIREPTQFRHLKKKLKKTQMLEGKNNSCSPKIQIDTQKLKEKIEFCQKR